MRLSVEKFLEKKIVTFSQDSAQIRMHTSFIIFTNCWVNKLLAVISKSPINLVTNFLFTKMLTNISVHAYTGRKAFCYGILMNPQG